MLSYTYTIAKEKSTHKSEDQHQVTSEKNKKQTNNPMFTSQ